MLNAENSLVLIIDVQDKLVGALEKDTIVSKTSKLVKAANTLGIPLCITEQYPKGLGNTVDSVSVNLPSNVKIFEKTYFNALLENDVLEYIKCCDRTQIVICGIETHICVYQTVVALLELGFEVYVVQDACASRNKYEYKQGIASMKDFGARLTCLEMLLFEWLKGSKNPKFKEIQALIK